MCGILGSVNLPFEVPTLDLIQHRGPDSMGMSHHIAGPHRVQLGHRRLAIVDLSSAGQQPMTSMQGDATLIYNGEVYNHLALRRSLNEMPFRGHSDTETVLNLLHKFGIKSVAELNGIFGFAYLDSRLGKLYLARDPFGVKPLYYRVKDNSLVFSSELKPLLRLIPDDLRRENLAVALRLRYTPSPATLWSNTKRLKPGHVLEVDLHHTELRFREYSYVRALPTQSKLKFTAAVRRYGELFEAAVERQLMADVDVGILLSGGVDSALVAALAKKHSSSSPRCFTIGFNGESDADETPDAAATAATVGLPHEIFHIDQGDFFDALEKCTMIVEEPLATTSIVPMHYLCRQVSRHVKVALTGQGADEPLGGYLRYQGEVIASRLPRFLARAALAIGEYTNFDSAPIMKGLRAACTTDDIARFIGSYSVFERDEIQRLCGVNDTESDRLLRYFYDTLDLKSQPRSVERMMSLDLRTNLADDLLLYTDKISMHHSLECRVPMLDLELIQFIESLPASYRVTATTGKRIHKAYATSYLPAEIVNRPKKSFQSPTAKWFRTGDRLRDILLARNSTFARFFDLTEVERLIRQHEAGRNREKHLFMLLSCFYWMQAML